jgi:signal transduction histidine kinase
MADGEATSKPGFRAAFLANEQQVRINTGKVACMLVITLMPAGVILDLFVYHNRHDILLFLGFRLICSVLAAGLLYLHTTKFGERHYQYLGLPIALLPAGFIALMIHVEQGPISPYYAGLNLILLSVSVVVHWSLRESVLAVVGVFLMYIAASFTRTDYAKWDGGIIFNNFYFLTLTGIIVVVGNYFFNRLRFREFALRFELDENRQALAESNQKLMELDQIKGRFFANISHELRTPLTLLLSPLETMLHGRDRQIDPDSRNLMTIMHGNGLRLLKLINDLLDLVRLESGRMEVKREPLEMTAFIRGLMGAPQQMAGAKGLNLEIHVESAIGAVLADRDKLEKMILNLVFNALKFTPTGGTVFVRVEKVGEEMVMSVKDTGVGISAKNLPFVFDRFWQADNSSKRKYQGVGIGLSLVKELTEIQNGKVSVESEEGKGTIFTIRLPFLPAQAPAQTQPQPPAEAPRAPVEAPVPPTTAPMPTPAIGPAPISTPAKPAAPAQSEEWLGDLYRRAALFPVNVEVESTTSPAAENGKNGNGLPTLVVADDEPDMLRFLKSQLQTRYHVIEAVDGLQALEKSFKHTPEIILLDMNMPGKDGLQVCRELREKPATREIPVIILTARADEETKIASLSAGANDFLSKPFSTTELHVRIKNLVQSHQYQDKLSRQNDELESTIEKLKETETLLVQTEKMVSLGRMSAGIIHEINNPLNYATTGLYSLRNKAKLLSGDQRAEYEDILKDVEEGIGRVKTIVTDLKTFSHPDAEHVDSVDAATVIGLALRFLSNEWRDKLEVTQILAEHVTIRGNRNKLVQVFVILFENAIDALNRKKFEGGEKPAISVQSTQSGDRISFTIRDNGEGIEASHLNKIFDPFFTTKDVGEGMGLGLTICYRIVHEYKGTISVQSERGKFCEFKLEFPAK